VHGTETGITTHKSSLVPGFPCTVQVDCLQYVKTEDDGQVYTFIM